MATSAPTPLLALFERLEGKLADVDRAVVLDQHDRLHGASRLWAVEAVELLQMSDEVGAAFGRARVHDEPARDVIERADHYHFLGLSGGGHAQVHPALGPRPRQIRVGERFAFVAVEQHDVAGRGLGLAQLRRSPTRSIASAFWRPFSLCRGRRQRKFFFAAPWTTASG